MHFRMYEFCAANPDVDAMPPFVVVDRATGALIEQVVEFGDEQGWVRVNCLDGDGRFIVDPDTDAIVTEVVYRPFRVTDRPGVPELESMPRVYVGARR